MRRLRGVMAVLMAIAALGLVACGGDSDAGGGEGGAALSAEEYEEVLAEFGNDFGEAFQQLGELDDASSPEEAVDLLNRAESLARESASDLEAITPPSDVADPHARLVGALNALGDTFAEAADAAEAGDAERLATLTSSPPDALIELERAAEEITAAGYGSGG